MKTAPKPKACRNCRQLFTPARPMQRDCSVPCAVTVARAAQDAKSAKAYDRETRRLKAATKPRGKHLQECQAAFNAYIRERDHGQPCISCQRHHDGQNHAGHYRTVGAQPALRFEPLNCHLQCAPCNSHLSGNLIEYRIHLEAKIGTDALAWLEGPHEPVKYSINEIIEIKARYRALARELKRARGEA